jgi:hypothetical protein
MKNQNETTVVDATPEKKDDLLFIGIMIVVVIVTAIVCVVMTQGAKAIASVDEVMAQLLS